MNKEKKNILIAGANGNTGKIITKILKESVYYNPIAMVRKSEQKKYFENQNVSVVVADLERDLGHALKNIDKVIFAAGSKGKNVLGVDQEGAKRLIDAAKNADVKKFVMLSSMGADDPSGSDHLEDYLRAKQNADDYLKSSELNYSIARPGSLTDTEGVGRIQLEEKLKNPGNISRADVAETLVEVLKDDIMQNQVFEILAGEVLIKEALVSA